jgi:hypothetical protein
MENEERITMAVDLLNQGVAEDEIVKRLRFAHKVKVKEASAILLQAMERTRTATKQVTGDPEPTKEESTEIIAHTENSNTSEEKVEELSEVEKAKQWAGEGNDMPCSVYGEQDLSDPGCDACKRDCPVTFAFCSVLSNKPKTVKKVASTTGDKTSRKRVKGAGYEKVKYIEGLITEGTHTQKEIVALAMEQYPEVKRITITTYISDSKNPSEKYGYARHGFSSLAKVTDGKLHY